MIVATVGKLSRLMNYNLSSIITSVTMLSQLGHHFEYQLIVMLS